MSKTTTPFKMDGIKFIPTNCYAPAHWMAKHLFYPFTQFDTADERDAINKACLANAIAQAFEANGKRGVNNVPELEILINATFKIVGF